MRTATDSIEIDAPPTAVIDLLGDPTRVPQWAPGFADAVQAAAGSRWTASKDGRSFSLRVLVMREAGTVDYLRELAPGREVGAYIRATPRPGAGTVITMTLPLVGGVDPAEIRKTLREELMAIASLAQNP
jgi:hypothetical protein